MFRFLLIVMILMGTASVAQVTPDKEGFRVTGRVTVQHPRGKHGDNGSVVVWLTPLEHSLQVKPADNLRLVQKDKTFEPHLLVVPLGSRVEFPNLDPLFHNVFSLYEGKRFDLGLYEAGGSRFVNFTRPGVSYIFCNIHPEMSAVVVALPTPYYAVTNGMGEYAISGVEPGAYEMKFWYERAAPEDLAKLSHRITVTGSTTLEPMRIAETKPAFEHKNKYGQDYDVNPPYEPGR